MNGVREVAATMGDGTGVDGAIAAVLVLLVFGVGMALSGRARVAAAVVMFIMGALMLSWAAYGTFFAPPATP